jgi:hypothetical protein
MEKIGNCGFAWNRSIEFIQKDAGIRDQEIIFPIIDPNNFMN